MTMLTRLRIITYRTLEQIDGEKHHFILISYNKAQLFKWRILTRIKL
jgi:hypothetical protein